MKTTSTAVHSGRHLLAVLVAVLVTGLGGALYGHYSQRWGPPADLVAAAEQLEQLPQRIGPWLMIEEVPIGEPALEMLQCAGYTHRRYVNQETGDEVKVAVIVGPPGPTAVHTPEICYSSRAFEREGPRRKVSIEAGPSRQHEWWYVDFTSRNVFAEGLRVYYAWSPGREWQASESPRWEFAAAPFLYKLQLAVPLQPGQHEEETDPGREFLAALARTDWRLATR